MVVGNYTVVVRVSIRDATDAVSKDFNVNIKIMPDCYKPIFNATDFFIYEISNAKFSKGEVAAAVICLLVVAGISAIAGCLIIESKE